MRTIKLRNREEIPIGKIVCVGRNYMEHVKELGNVAEEKPVVFLKPASAVIYSGGKIKIPSFSQNVHYETELVLLIGNTVKDADKEKAENAIAGFGTGLDMTLRDVQNKLKEQGHPWTIAKCFDTSAVLSDFISVKDYRLTLNEEIILTVNGIEKQHEKLNKMIFPPVQIVEYLSSLMTLEKGDLIFTGTPAGVGKVEKGDKLHAAITEVAVLDCEVE